MTLVKNLRNYVEDMLALPTLANINGVVTGNATKSGKNEKDEAGKMGK